MVMPDEPTEPNIPAGGVKELLAWRNLWAWVKGLHDHTGTLPTSDEVDAAIGSATSGLQPTVFVGLGSFRTQLGSPTSALVNNVDVIGLPDGSITVLAATARVPAGWESVKVTALWVNASAATGDVVLRCDRMPWTVGATLSRPAGCPTTKSSSPTKSSPRRESRSTGRCTTAGSSPPG